MTENPRTGAQSIHSIPKANPSASSGAKTLFRILSTVPVSELETELTRSGIPPHPECVEEVLKLCYDSPAAAIKFFGWAGRIAKHTSYSWNLMIDILGKNRLFEAMWDAIRTMRQEGVLSLPTFASVFGSYCVADKVNEAIMSFDVMGRFGIHQDVVALNSLLSAICREDKKMSKAIEFFERVKIKIPPNADTYAILLEGCEKEGNVAIAKTTFGEMAIRIGWSPLNMSAYEAFLTTLVKASQTDEAIKFLKFMKDKDCLPGMKFFSNALNVLIHQGNATHALSLWDIMVGNGLLPNLTMYNGMIGLLSDKNEIDKAFDLLDEMVFNGVFSDPVSYNEILHSLLKSKKVRGAANFFFEMKKNEQQPTHRNCTTAIKMFFEGDDPEMAIEVWNYMIENHVRPIEESASALLIGLRNLDRFTEMRKFLDDMLDRKIDISESTMSKLKSAFRRAGRSEQDAFTRLARRWKPK
ncbi:hypothetical protein Sjap_003985 [Stephania japonica]|uniref:Pentatricopeptide repeat-containing protein n=1 Tax=Stephania japonica TaxID=461633 RepID=A0AAP0PHD7_9MAGN